MKKEFMYIPTPHVHTREETTFRITHTKEEKKNNKRAVEWNGKRKERKKEDDTKSKLLLQLV